MLPLQQRERRRKVRLVAKIQHEDVRLRRAGCASVASSEPGADGDVMPQCRSASSSCRSVDPTRTMFAAKTVSYRTSRMTLMNAAESSVVPVPLANEPGSVTILPTTSFVGSSQLLLFVVSS